MKLYTVGFVFNASLEKVLLIHKLRPSWQSGKLNGIGGKIETNETSQECIVREVFEESGLQTTPSHWNFCGKNSAPEWVVDFYAYQYTGNEDDAKSITDEIIEWIHLDSLPSTLIPNLHWLIPLCKNKLTDREYLNFIIEYQK